MNALNLAVAILRELERQHPDCRITQKQMDAIQQAANAIKDAMESPSAETCILSVPGKN